MVYVPIRLTALKKKTPIYDSRPLPNDIIKQHTVSIKGRWDKTLTVLDCIVLLLGTFGALLTVVRLVVPSVSVVAGLIVVAGGNAGGKIARGVGAGVVVVVVVDVVVALVVVGRVGGLVGCGGGTAA